MATLSILDPSLGPSLGPSTVSGGMAHDQAVRDTIELAQLHEASGELAQLCEAPGYRRFWVSGHRNHPTITGSAQTPGGKLRTLAGTPADTHGVDEIVVLTSTYAQADRRRSYALPMGEFSLTKPTGTKPTGAPA